MGALTFAAPWLLAALAVLPVIWFLLRALPPTPKRVLFPPLRFLLGLKDKEETPARTPWWLMLLRMAMAALVILALAGPVWNAVQGAGKSGPLVVVVDNGWRAAGAWDLRERTLNGLLTAAQQDNRQVALIGTAPRLPERPARLMSASDARGSLPTIAPVSWSSDRAAAATALGDLLAGISDTETVDIVWLADGTGGRGAGDLATAIASAGGGRVLMPDATQGAIAIRAATNTPDGLAVSVVRAPGGDPMARTGEVRLFDRAGRPLEASGYAFAPDETVTGLRFDLPLELRNEVGRVELTGVPSAGAVFLLDESARRRPVGIVSRDAGDGSQPLLSDDYYLRRALDPYAELRAGDLETLLGRPLAVLIMADTGRIVGESQANVANWVQDGGVLVRFAGPRLAAQGDGLLPVRPRVGGRALGGAMAWAEPQRLDDFPEGSPFAGLAVPEDVTIRRQILAEPSIDLTDKTWARLTDGTPLVTAERRGDGWIVLFHVTANRDWSSLPISGLFVEMLRRLITLAEGVPAESLAAEGSSVLPPVRVLDGEGALTAPPPIARPLRLTEGTGPQFGPRHPPGFYGPEAAPRAFNAVGGEFTFTPMPALPPALTRAAYAGADTVDLTPWLLTAALILALVDQLVALALRGLLPMPGGTRRLAGRGAAAALVLTAGAGMLAAALLVAPMPAAAQSAADIKALEATEATRFAYVVTGQPDVDTMSRRGLSGLSRTLFTRTTVEPEDPHGVDPETDELSLYPFLYWRITPQQPDISETALARIDAFMKGGGTILFDTGDQSQNFGTDVSPSTRRLREILSGLDIPPLVPVPEDHILTKAFYLMDEFPGRWAGGDVWVEAPRSADNPGGATVSNNDGVSSIIIGSHDWAAAWAIDEDGTPLAAVVPGGERQREMARRFGVNLVMYTLTGNYKADQVHVRPLLERLGQ